MLIIYDDFFQKHNTGNFHPENGGRLNAIKQAIDKKILSDQIFKQFVKFESPLKAEPRQLYAVHKDNYVNKIKDISDSGALYYIDPDTVVSEYTYECAVLAAGACISGIDYLLDKPESNISESKDGNSLKAFFALVRPPGHHAFPSGGSGFCIFNNIAIAAKYAASQYGIKKIAVIDFDVHHGNGTQDIFFYDNKVFYVSLHQYPHYPGTGYWNETGEKKGKGFNLNIPMTAFSEEDDYVVAFTDIIIPVLTEYCPELILVSAGFDAHRDDPLSNIGLDDESYYKIMKMILFLSKACSLKTKSRHTCNIGIVLEGGYDYKAISRSSLEVIRACIEEEKCFQNSLIIKENMLNNKIEIGTGTCGRQIRNLYRMKEYFLSGSGITGGVSKKNSETFNIIRNIFSNSFKILSAICVTILCVFLLAASFGCRQYDNKMDVSYFFKTSPEQAVIDFIYAMNNHDADYIYANFLPESDRRNISRDKFIREMTEILSDIKNIAIERIIYMGYEDSMGKVVIEFKVEYVNGDEGDYKKYIYLIEENGKWKIVFDKTFI